MSSDAQPSGQSLIVTRQERNGFPAFGFPKAGSSPLISSVLAGARPVFAPQKDGNDSYRITLAVAGFRPEDTEAVAQQNLLTVTGKRAEDDGKGGYRHRGIAARAFERRFQLADFIKAGEASFENGLLSIGLKRVVPEAMKPRRIEISGNASANDNDVGPFPSSALPSDA
jgi:molecular chaperone IbpA